MDTGRSRAKESSIPSGGLARGSGEMEEGVEEEVDADASSGTDKGRSVVSNVRA